MDFAPTFPPMALLTGVFFICSVLTFKKVRE